MELTISTERIYALYLSEVEARWLQDTMRNPFTVDKDDEKDKMRKTLFDTLKRRKYNGIN